MKTSLPSEPNKFGPYRFLAALCTVLIGAPLAARSTDLTYDYTTNPGWFAAGAWTPGPTLWSAGANATIDVGSTKSIDFDQSTTIGNFTLTGNTGSSATLTDLSARTLTFSGGTINTSTVLTTGGGVSLQGNFIKEGNGFVRLSATSTAAAYSGTATVNAGVFEAFTPTTVGSNSNVIVNTNGTFGLRNTGTYTMGSITLNGGTLSLGRTNGTITLAATVASLSGSGGNVMVNARTGTAATSNFTLNINQSSNTTFNANINGYSSNATPSEAFLTLNKQGSGSLALGGSIDLRRQTTVEGGTLLINSSTATFTNGLGTTAISINATLGGTGTLQITGGDNVIVGGTGSLVAGLAGLAGRTTFDLSGGSLDLSAATAGSSTGWLRFDLGADTTAGTTYDQILLTGTGNLNIGTGLSFSDFQFTTLSGFGPGTYVLFDTSDAILGSLGMATGTLGAFDAELKLIDSGFGTNLVLEVVPEPNSWALLGIGLVIVLARLRPRRLC